MIPKYLDRVRGVHIPHEEFFVSGIDDLTNRSVFHNANVIGVLHTP